MAGNKSRLTPLQQEAQRLADEQRRRQDAVKAAQQFALRAQLDARKKKATAESATEEKKDSPPPVDFDAVRAALHDERHRESKKNHGANPRHIAAMDDNSRHDQEESER